MYENTECTVAGTNILPLTHYKDEDIETLETIRSDSEHLLQLVTS